jgi:diadenosine tetraphosphate (Ap4A) HIT family hydrolase
VFNTGLTESLPNTAVCGIIKRHHTRRITLPNFKLHPQLAQDCIFLSDLRLCRLLLMNNKDFPWCILVPRINGIREIHELDEADQQTLLKESSGLSRVMLGVFSGEKMNIAALGNMVPQLHLHHIVRTETDKAWPNPVWGYGGGAVYSTEEIEELSDKLTAEFKANH